MPAEPELLFDGPAHAARTVALAHGARAGKIPRELSAIAMKALAKEPNERYPNVGELRQDIERFQGGRSVTAKQDTFKEMAWKLVKRNKGASIATHQRKGCSPFPRAA